MNNEVEKVIQKVLIQYPNIDTVLLFGSANNSGWTNESDIDLFFIDDNLSNGRIDLKIDGISVEVQTDNFAGIFENIECERGSLLNRNVANMIATSFTVKNSSIDRFNDIKRLSEEIIASKTAYSEEDIKMWKYSIIDYLGKAEKDLNRNDEVAFYFDAHYVIQNAVELILAQNGDYFPQPKNLMKVLDAINPDIAVLLADFAKSQNMEESLKCLRLIKTKLVE